MRYCIIAILAVLCLQGQPQNPVFRAVPSVADVIGGFEAYEQRANGSNRLRIEAVNNLPANLTWSPDAIGSRAWRMYLDATYSNSNSFNWSVVSAFGTCSPANAVVSLSMNLTYTNAGSGSVDPLAYTGRPCTSFGTSPLDAWTFRGSVNPAVDNNWTLGATGQRWADIKTVLLNGATPVTTASLPLTISAGNIACATCAATNVGNTFTADQNFQSINTYNVLPRANNTYILGGNGFEWQEGWINELLMRTGSTYGIYAGFPASTPTVLVGSNDGAGNLSAGFPGVLINTFGEAIYGAKGGVTQAAIVLTWDFVHPTQAAAITQVRDYTGAINLGQHVTVTIGNGLGGTCTLTFTAGWLTSETCP
jgi:hypothetical protein